MSPCAFKRPFSIVLCAIAVACSTSAAPDVPRAEYDEQGQLRALRFDANRNGHNDAVANTQIGRAHV